MLAVIVRRNGFPVVSVPHVATLALSPLLGQERPEVAMEQVVVDAEHPDAQSQSAMAQPGLPATGHDAVRVRRVEPEAHDTAKQALLQRVQQGLTAEEVAALSVDEAQMLSILATSRGLRLEHGVDGGLVASPREPVSASEFGGMRTDGRATDEHADDSQGPPEPESGTDAEASPPHEVELELGRPRSLCLSYAPPLPPPGSDEATSAAPSGRTQKSRKAKKKTSANARRRRPEAPPSAEQSPGHEQGERND